MPCYVIETSGLNFDFITGQQHGVTPVVQGLLQIRT